MFKKFELLLFCITGLLCTSVYAFDAYHESYQDTLSYKEYKGIVVDSETADPLVFASITLQGTNISTVTNGDGEFSIKIPKSFAGDQIIISFLGYNEKRVPVSILKDEDTVIKLNMLVTQLPEVMVATANDATVLIKQMLDKINQNYINDPLLMTAFYRETIKKRRRNVSLAEAVVNIFKTPYNSAREDVISLYKVRKKTDYKRLDTLTLKLQGGPYNPLRLDLMKYPEYVFSDLFMKYYNFKMSNSTRINDRLVYVVEFKQKENVVTPLYYGKLYIDANTTALISALYNLNVENRKLASDLLVRKKPNNAKVYPTRAMYKVDYKMKNEKWYYSYSNVQMEFKVDWKRKLFNSVFTLNSEMAVTNWEKDGENRPKGKERLKMSAFIPDEAEGFLDDGFWGAYNVIEPEKSIESAIRKIERTIEKEK